MKRKSNLSVITTSALFFGTLLVALPALANDDRAERPEHAKHAEHAEHPEYAKHAEHPEHAEYGNVRATASFGRGLNTAYPGNVVNHAVLPGLIKIKAGGVVDFAVAGFHDIVIFKPTFTLANLLHAGGGMYPTTLERFVIPPNPADDLPVGLSFLKDSIYYRGISPAGGPLKTVVMGNPANGSNRSEPVAFLERGTYLVICNVRQHLIDGMYAYVKVD